MPFSRDSYRPLDSSIKYGCAETDELCGLQQTSQNDEEDDDLAGYSLDFAEPKNSFAVQVRRSFAILHFVLKVAFGKWPIALCILICYIGLVIGLSVIALTGRYHEFRKDISLDSFMVPDIKVSSDYAAFKAAKEQGKSSFPYSFRAFLMADTCTGNKIDSSPSKARSRVKRSPKYVERDFQRTLSWSLDLVYVAKGGDNIFTEDRLQEIHKIENTLMNHKNYKKHCYISSLSLEDDNLRKYGNCTPPNSLTTFFYASEEYPDGQNNILARDISETLQYLKSKDYFFSYVSDDFSKKDSSKILRAQILFGSPVKGIPTDKSTQKEEYKRFVTTYVDALDDLNNNKYVSFLNGVTTIFNINCYYINYSNDIFT